MVWVHFKGLNVMFYDESAIKVIASTVGRPVKVDITTKTAERRRFVRACVEVDQQHALDLYLKALERYKSEEKRLWSPSVFFEVANFATKIKKYAFAFTITFT